MVCPFWLISLWRKWGEGIQKGKDKPPKTKSHCNSVSVLTKKKKSLPALNNREIPSKEKTKAHGTFFNQPDREGWKDKAFPTPSNWNSRDPPESSAALLCCHTGERKKKKKFWIQPYSTKALGGRGGSRDLFVSPSPYSRPSTYKTTVIHRFSPTLYVHNRNQNSTSTRLNLCII